MGVHGGLIKAFVTTLPFTLVGVLGAYNQIASSSYDTPEYGTVVGERVSAYCEPVGLTHRLLGSRSAEPEATTTRKVAMVWVRKFEAGQLLDLPPMAGGDSTREGVKQQILAAKATVLADLIREADLEVVGGHPDRAISNYLLSLKLTRVMMFSDLTSLGNSISLENCIIRRLIALEQDVPLVRRACQADIDKALNAEYRATLSDPTLKDEQRTRMADQFKRATAGGEDLKLILDDPKNDYELSLLFANAKRVHALIALQGKILASKDENAPNVLARSIFGDRPV